MTCKTTFAIALAAALPLLASAQAPAFKDFREAINATDQALRAKKNDEALRLAQAALAFTAQGSPDRVAALDRIANARAAQEQWAGILADVKPEVVACTNFSKALPLLRTCFTAVGRAAIKAGDPETFKVLVAALAREPVDDATFPLWRDAANLLAQEALDLRLKPAPKAEANAGIAGFREGGTTFGLWQTPLQIDGQIVMDATRLADAAQLLTQQMPQAGLSPKFQFLRDRALLDIQVLAGSESGRRQAYDALAKAVLTFRPADSEGTNALSQAFDALVAYHENRLSWLEAAETVNAFAAQRADFVGSAQATLIGRTAGYYFRAGADTLHKAALDTLAARPFTADVFNGYIALVGIVNRDNQAYASIPRLLKPVIDRQASLSLEQRHTLAGWRFEVAVRMIDVQTAQACFRELTELDAAFTAAVAAENRKAEEAKAKGQIYQKLNPPRTAFNIQHRIRYATLMLEERALPEAVAAYEARVAFDPRSSDAHVGLAVARMLAGKDKEARDGLDAFVTNTVFGADARFAGRVLQAVVDTPELAAFKRGVMALRPYSDAEAVKGESAADGDTRFFNWLRAATRRVFATERVDHVLALQECSEMLKHPEIRLVYTARYMENVPTRAETWMRSGLFADDTLVERRFGRYGMFSSINKESELARLKSKPAPELGVCPAGEEGGLIVAFDDRGLHLYAQFNDPKSHEIRDGLRNGVAIELTVSPGDKHSYHQTFYSTTEPVDTVDLEWDTVHAGYRMTRDFVRNDCCQSEQATGAYTFMPWVMFYDKLPADGDVWRVVLVAGWAKQFRSLGGGSVHELGRGLQVKFDMPPAVAARIRAGVVKAATAVYRKARTPWENAGFWSDPHMGDEAFAETVVKPFLKELDDAAKLVTGAEKPLSQPEYDRLFKEVVPSWIDFRLKLDALRADYLEKQFFL